MEIKNGIFRVSVCAAIALLVACGQDSLERKGFQVREITENDKGEKVVGLKMDSLELETRPRNVLSTFHPSHRLIPIYKVNYDKKTKKPFTGSNDFHGRWRGDSNEGNNWNGNFMPGFAALYGYNLINVSHHNVKTNSSHPIFDRPVLIKTLYYPAFSKDTLNYQPVKRDFYMISVYDEDSNNDGFVTSKDLRRFYLFDLEGKKSGTLVPKTHSVMNSEYDRANDYMYVFAKKDTNANGQMETAEPTDIFWIDLKSPENRGLLYASP